MSESQTNSKSKTDQTKSAFALPKKEEMATPIELVEKIRSVCTEEEKRFAFRELAKDLLDPESMKISSLFDNEGNLLGYFEPIVHHFRESGRKFSGIAKSREDILEGSVSAREFIEGVLQERNAND